MKKQKPSKTQEPSELTSKNTKKSEVTSGEVHIEMASPPFNFPADKLMQALYWVWDAFERSSMGMFLVYKTAEDVLQNIDLEGDRITVGIRGNEWRSGSTPILKSFTGEPLEVTDSYERFKNPFNDVPVYVYIFEEDECIKSPQQVFYKAEYFKLPNSYKRFMDVFGAKP